MRYVVCVGLALLAISAGSAAEPSSTIVEETWENATVEDAKIGYVHTMVRAFEADGKKRLRATVQFDFSFTRQNTPMRVRMEHGTDETPEGKVIGVFMRQFHERGQPLNLVGTLEGEKMHVLVDNGRIEAPSCAGRRRSSAFNIGSIFSRRRSPNRATVSASSITNRR